MYQRTGERLQTYHAFSDAIIHTVAEVADMQAAMDYQAFMRRFSIPEPEVVGVNGSHFSEVLDIKPVVDYDTTVARFVHLPMAARLDDRQRYQIATNYAVDSSVRTIAFSNPGTPRHKAGILTLKNCLEIVRGNARPLIDPALQYGEREKITTVEHGGFSYGDLLALTATEYASKYNQTVSHITVIDPADVEYRGDNRLWSMISLGLDFVKTGGPLADYIKASGIYAYINVGDNSLFGLAKYGLGLARASNLVVANTLAGDYFAERTERALEAQPWARMHAIWGTDSELAIHGLMLAATDYLSDQYPERFERTYIPGGRHNMVNDIHLYAALTLHARRQAPPSL